MEGHAVETKLSSSLYLSAFIFLALWLCPFALISISCFRLFHQVIPASPQSFCMYPPVCLTLTIMWGNPCVWLCIFLGLSIEGNIVWSWFMSTLYKFVMELIKLKHGRLCGPDCSFLSPGVHHPISLSDPCSHSSPTPGVICILIISFVWASTNLSFLSVSTKMWLFALPCCSYSSTCTF